MNDTTTTTSATTGDGDLGEVVITRELDAPRELVFRAMLDPEQLVQFWGPVGTHVPIESVVIEPWAGGRFENTMVPDDATGDDAAGFPMKATFTEVVEPELLVFVEVDSGLVSTSTFTDLGNDRTLLTIHQTKVPPEFRTPEALAGFNTSLDRLETYLATIG
jgi:uncharacterized protein YndB with AHSA1/START domain